MKKLILLGLALTLLSCGSSDDGFKDANGNVAKRYVTKTVTTGSNYSSIFNVTYNSTKKVLTASDGENTKAFIYNTNGKLERISGGGENLFTSEVVGQIHDAFEIGKVLQYDSKGNPKVLELFQHDNYTGVVETYTATLTYDDKPFTFYYTLDAAGIIEVLNDTRLNFNMNPSSPQIVMAKKLLMVNNPIGAVIKNENNVETARIDVTYNYNSDSYPTSSTVISNSNNEISQYSVTYEYLP